MLLYPIQSAAKILVPASVVLCTKGYDAQQFFEAAWKNRYALSLAKINNLDDLDENYIT